MLLVELEFLKLTLSIRLSFDTSLRGISDNAISADMETRCYSLHERSVHASEPLSVTMRKQNTKSSGIFVVIHFHELSSGLPQRLRRGSTGGTAQKVRIQEAE